MNNSRGKRSSIPPYKTRPDSPVPTLQGPWGNIPPQRTLLPKTQEVLSFPFKWSEAKVTQSCPTLCDPVDYIVLGILQARILKCVAFPFSRGSSQPRSPALQADSLPAEPQRKPCGGYFPYNAFWAEVTFNIMNLFVAWNKEHIN